MPTTARAPSCKWRPARARPTPPPPPSTACSGTPVRAGCSSSWTVATRRGRDARVQRLRYSRRRSQVHRALQRPADAEQPLRRRLQGHGLPYPAKAVSYRGPDVVRSPTAPSPMEVSCRLSSATGDGSGVQMKSAGACTAQASVGTKSSLATAPSPFVDERRCSKRLPLRSMARGDGGGR